MTNVRSPRASASSDSTRSTIARALKSGVAAGGSARPVAPAGVPDRVEQREPELLRVVLIALHLQRRRAGAADPDGRPRRAAVMSSRCRPEPR